MMAVETPTFVKMVTISNEFEIRSSVLAKQNVDQNGVKKAADIISNHKNVCEKLKATLEAKGGAPAELVELAP